MPHRTWWWDSWVEPNNLYYHYKPFSDFVSRLQLAEYTWTSISPKVMANTTDVIRAWGIAGKGEGGKELVLTWIQDECYTWPNQSSGKACPTFAGFKLTASCAIPSGTEVLLSLSTVVLSIYRDDHGLSPL